MRQRAGPDGLVWSQPHRRGEAARPAVFHAPAPRSTGLACAPEGDKAGRVAPGGDQIRYRATS